MRTDTSRRLRRITSVAIATTFLTQNFAWAVCSDGLGFPPGQTSYVSALLPPSLQNMASNTFTSTAGSYFIPDNSTCEDNDGTPSVPPGGPVTRPCHGPT